jgi:hypothetical protein
MSSRVLSPEAGPVAQTSGSQVESVACIRCKFSPDGGMLVLLPPGH